MMETHFRFLPGIGYCKERRIRQEVKDWEGFLSAKRVGGISSSRKKYYDRLLREARRAWYEEDLHFFSKRFAQRDMFLLYPWLREDALFLDIETSGTGKRQFITVIGMYDGRDTKTMIQGINLDEGLLRREIARHKLLVTFNGACFDVPYLENFFPQLTAGIVHFDLRFACKQVGLSGGLKHIEHTLGLRRPRLVDGIHGGDAFTLWKMFQGSGDPYYLELLVEYNNEDIINLQPLADYVCKKLMV